MNLRKDHYHKKSVSERLIASLEQDRRRLKGYVVLPTGMSTDVSRDIV